MKSDKEVQIEILKKLKENPTKAYEINDLLYIGDSETIIRNIEYLYGHKLLTIGQVSSYGGLSIPISIKITSSGIDAIDPEYGLGEIINTVTVKFHQDTIRELLINKINGENIPDNEKYKIIEYIKTIPKTATNKVIEELVIYLIKNYHNISAYFHNL